MADMEAAIESKDSRTMALLKEKEKKIIRVKWPYLYFMHYMHLSPWQKNLKSFTVRIIKCILSTVT